jgi:hypothetical protein
MIVALWNLRGAEKKGISICLTDIIRDNMVDFVGLQETMKKSYDQKFFNKIDPFNSFFGNGFLLWVNLGVFYVVQELIPWMCNLSSWVDL